MFGFLILPKSFIVNLGKPFCSMTKLNRLKFNWLLTFFILFFHAYIHCKWDRRIYNYAVTKLRCTFLSERSIDAKAIGFLLSINLSLIHTQKCLLAIIHFSNLTKDNSRITIPTIKTNIVPIMSRTHFKLVL